MKKILMLVLLLVSGVASAQTILVGAITQKSQIIAGNAKAWLKPQSTQLPISHYDIPVIYISNLGYGNDVPESNRKFNLQTYKKIIASGKLNLVYYDEKSGNFKYQLSIYPQQLGFGVVDNATVANIPIKAALNLDKVNLYIEGRIKNNKIILTSSSNSSFVGRPEQQNSIVLTVVHDIPVTIIIE